MQRVIPVHSHFRRLRAALLLLALPLVGCWEVEPDLLVGTEEIDFGSVRESAEVSVFNDSYDNALTSGVVALEYRFQPDRPWITVTPPSGRCGEAEKRVHIVTVDRALMAYGENLATIAVTSNGGAATIQVKATRAVPGCSDPPLVPDSPVPATASTGVATSVELSWEGGDSRCSELTATYDVYFGTTSPPRFHHDNDTLKVWTPATLAKNTLYYWRVVARDANGTTSGPEWQFRTVCTLGPTAVTLISPPNAAAGVPVTDAVLSWGGGNSQCPGLSRTYDVYFGTTSPPPFAASTPDQSWEPGTLEKGTTYRWRIVARDANGSVASAERSFTTEVAPCTIQASAVTLLSPANNALDVPVTQDLTWSGGDSQCPGLTATYDVYFGTATPPPFHHNNGTSKTWDAPLDYNTVYYWRVVAKDANGSVASSERTFRTPCTLSPTAPAPAHPADGATSVAITDNLTWTGGNSQCAGLGATYDIHFGTTSPPPFVVNNGATKAWSPGSMQPDTRYFWRIVAKDANGATESPVWSFTTEALCLTPPSAPCSPNPFNGRTGVNENANLSWSCGESACGLAVTYDVYFGETALLGDEHRLGSTVERSWNLPRLRSSTTYYWKIVARDANGTVTGPVWNFTTRAGL